jgi:hypothetical protein
MATSLKSAMAPLNSISRSFTTNTSQTSYNMINALLSNDYLRTFLLTVAGVYAGYTLQPVPRKLNKLFDTSTPFKFLILFIMILTAYYPIDNHKVILALLIPILVLTFFEFLRQADDMEGEDLIGSIKGSIKSVVFSFKPPTLKSLFGCN